MRVNLVLLLAGVLCASRVPALAQEGQGGCVAGSAAPPAELAGWATRLPLPAATRPASLPAARLVVGRGVDATLAPTPQVQYVTRPEKPGGSVSFGGLFGFTVQRAGTYRVALGAGAWIDVLKGGKPMVSTAHGHGPDCTGIRKLVDFPLTPGRYTVQVSANGEAALALLVARLP